MLEMLVVIAGTAVLLSLLAFSTLWSFIAMSRVLRGKSSPFTVKSILPIILVAACISFFIFIVPDLVANKLNPILPNQQKYLPPPSREATRKTLNL
jgi:uncharacterized protein YybS (DUF2232 family)